ncbi:hypothetical protein N308_01116, partial [Struthio camelus australis]
VVVVVVVLLLLVLTEVEVLVGGNGHPDDEEHHLAKAELVVLVGVQVLEDLVNGDLVLHMLQRKGQ